jgi:hypothetical protein
MPTNRKRTERKHFRITPEMAALYKTAVTNWCHQQECAKLDYPQKCDNHSVCLEYKDARAKLWPLLGQMPHEACPLQPWEGLLWDRYNEKIISIKKALELSIGNSLPDDLDEQIMRINAEIAENGRW